MTRVRGEFIPDRKFISAPHWRRQILIKKGRVEGDVFGTASRMICCESGRRRGLPSEWTRPHTDTGGGQLAARYNYNAVAVSIALLFQRVHSILIQLFFGRYICMARNFFISLH